MPDVTGRLRRGSCCEVTMGVLTDFVVAKREQAEQVARSSNPSEELDGIPAKGVNTDTLAALYAILSGDPHPSHFMTDALLVQESPRGRWVLAVPAKLVCLLAALVPKRLDDAAVAWAVVRGEMEFADWSLEEVRGVLA